MEFQARGTLHLHLFVVPPSGLSASDCAGDAGSLPFTSWLLRTWADVVAHPDPVQRSRHVLAGTAVDAADALTARDPKRIAINFGKRADPTGAAKEHQNHPPDLWTRDGKGVGRFWGYLDLRRVGER